ncbi:hypothetical protein IE53DRAFT_348631 [Violaceomyces palustris]|uniref:Uncharacterized protein n=1 Tax=Violaceomyces palustris TaxID=1673888 RepID=A0ACD0NPT6_9BASI|nr:hypothetical protein IE53DRAFT_348631 [Violaceomyces palustris]
MAKGLRASSKLAARNAKRSNPKSDYMVVQAARLNQVATRLAEQAKRPKITELGEDGEEKKADGDEGMTAQIDGEESKVKKISTSAPRDSRRETWRKAKGWKVHPGIGRSKNNGKAKRRR